MQQAYSVGTAAEALWLLHVSDRGEFSKAVLASIWWSTRLTCAPEDSSMLFISGLQVNSSVSLKSSSNMSMTFFTTYQALNRSRCKIACKIVVHQQVSNLPRLQKISLPNSWLPATAHFRVQALLLNSLLALEFLSLKHGYRPVGIEKVGSLCQLTSALDA